MSLIEPEPEPEPNLDISGGIHATLAERLPAVEPVLCRLIVAVDANDVGELLDAIDEYAATSTTLQWQTELTLMLAALIPADVPFRQLVARWTEAAA